MRNRDINQSNEIVGRIYYWDLGNGLKTKLNTNQMKILKIAMSVVNPKKSKKNNFEYSITLDEFEELMGLKCDDAKYVEIPDFLRKLMKEDVFRFEKSNGEIEFLHMFQKVTYSPTEKSVKFIFAKFNEYLMELDKQDCGYTKYRLGNIMEFKNVHSIIVYEYLKAKLIKRGQKNIYIELDELRERLGLINNYPRFFDFKKYVLEKVKEEINSSESDIKIENYSCQKSGRKITGITFEVVNANIKIDNEIAAGKVIELKKDDKVEGIDENVSSDIELIDKYRSMLETYPIKIELSYKDILSILSELKQGDNFNKVIEKHKMAMKKRKLSTYIGFMRKAIREDYKEDKSLVQQIGFNDFDQRDYNFDILEKKLLGQNVDECE